MVQLFFGYSAMIQHVMVLACTLFGCISLCPVRLCAELRVGTFSIDATPELGSPLAYDPMREATWPLSCKGLVILSGQDPIVLCAVDWIGIANEANEQFRTSLASAVGTSADRVVVHTLHQHDAPRADLTAAAILEPQGLAAAHFDVAFFHRVTKAAAQAAARAKDEAKVVSSIGVGQAMVKDVASNRRMLGPDGKVFMTRYTACKDPLVRDLPVGVIDPWLKSLSFRDQQATIAIVTFYATHPQSYYRTGGANPDFPGMARDVRQTASGIFHLHFNGAGGNIGAGKYNDGSKENRQILADKVAVGMREAYESEKLQAIHDVQLDWQSLGLDIPIAQHLDRATLQSTLTSPQTPFGQQVNAAAKLAFLNRREAGIKVPVSRLKLGNNQILFMPGELFVEYQLAAQHIAPNANIMMAAYGDYGTGYIGTRVAYPQGGYETSSGASNVAPETEAVLLAAMKELLDARQSQVLASDFTDTFGPALPSAK